MSFLKLTWYAVHLTEEKNLLAKAAQGDEAAFREIFEAYRRPVYAYAMHLLKNEAKADDVVQEVFLRVWLYRQRLTEIQSLNAWLFTIVKNKMIDSLKAQLKEQRFLKLVPANHQTAETEEAILSREYELLVHEALDHLTPQQQLIYHLSKQQGLRNQEIAVKLNISPHTVKSHLVHALRTIRKFITPHLSCFLAAVFLWVKEF